MNQRFILKIYRIRLRTVKTYVVFEFLMLDAKSTDTRKTSLWEIQFLFPCCFILSNKPILVQKFSGRFMKRRTFLDNVEERLQRVNDLMTFDLIQYHLPIWNWWPVLVKVASLFLLASFNVLIAGSQLEEEKADSKSCSSNQSFWKPDMRSNTKNSEVKVLCTRLLSR